MCIRDSTYTEYNKIKKALNTLNENKDEKEIQREIDLLKFQINEIEVASLSKDEYEDLLKQREIDVYKRQAIPHL